MNMQLVDFSALEYCFRCILSKKKKKMNSMLFHGFKKTKLVATLKKFYGRHHDLVNPYNVAVSRIVSDVFASDAL